MKPLDEQTHYEILEVDPGASRDEIGAAYERLHSLLGPGSLAVYSLVEPAEHDALMRRIDEAWAVLSSQAERRAYDASIGLAPAAPAIVRSSFADAVEAIRAAGGGSAAEGTAPAALPPAEASGDEPFATAEEPEEIALDDGDLLEVVEIEGMRLARLTEIFDRPPGEKTPIVREDRRLSLPGNTAAEEAAAPAQELYLDGDTHFSGALLRQVRESLGLTLDEIAHRTRILASHLENVEAERWDRLPERVFLRGYLIVYARELRLDPTQVCATYLARRDSGGKR